MKTTDYAQSKPLRDKNARIPIIKPAKSPTNILPVDNLAAGIRTD